MRCTTRTGTAADGGNFHVHRRRTGRVQSTALRYRALCSAANSTPPLRRRRWWWDVAQRIGLSSPPSLVVVPPLRFFLRTEKKVGLCGGRTQMRRCIKSAGCPLCDGADSETLHRRRRASSWMGENKTRSGSRNRMIISPRRLAHTCPPSTSTMMSSLTVFTCRSHSDSCC